MKSDDWRTFAACRNVDPEIPFMEPVSCPEVQGFIRNYCRPCPVKVECLKEAIEYGCKHGIFGGKVPKERTANPQARRRFDHGTLAAYKWHKKYGEKACSPCQEASRIYEQVRRDIRRARLAAQQRLEVIQPVPDVMQPAFEVARQMFEAA